MASPVTASSDPFPVPAGLTTLLRISDVNIFATTSSCPPGWGKPGAGIFTCNVPFNCNRKGKLILPKADGATTLARALNVPTELAVVKSWGSGAGGRSAAEPSASAPMRTLPGCRRAKASARFDRRLPTVALLLIVLPHENVRLRSVLLAPLLWLSLLTSKTGVRLRSAKSKRLLSKNARSRETQKDLFLLIFSSWITASHGH